MSQFKEKKIECYNCHNIIKRHEEKETDVAIAVRLLEVAILGKIDNLVIVSGDTDLKPAVITAKRLNPSIDIRFAFPYLRRHNELIKLAPKSFTIKPKQYLRYQFSNPYVLSDGTIIAKPSSW